MNNDELNKLICGNEETKEYVYKNVPYMGKRIEELVQLKMDYDTKMKLLMFDISCVLEWKRDELLPTT